MLTSGTRLGSYQIVAPLGRGGMGEVYRAKDLKLGRDVAIKVLPAVFMTDPERLARFEREARILAALNHPHIAAIHGLEESSASPISGQSPSTSEQSASTDQTVRALVLELVEGETLAERIARIGGSETGRVPQVTAPGPGEARGIPMNEALTIARQIAEALEAAHEKGIIHRDLKPGNIKITPDGIVKVLDFGLATAGPAEGSRPDLSHSPTITVGRTREGMVLGTAAYMSPEQARGDPVDRRADIWAFGCVLYEMLTGGRAFAGNDLSEVLAFVLVKDPDWSVLPVHTPVAVRKLLRRCLEKDRKRRLADIADARLEIDDLLQEATGSQSDVLAAQAIPRSVARRHRVTLLATAVILAVGLGASVTWWFAGPTPSTSASVARTMITLPAGQALEKGRFPPVALSPDGTLLVYAAAVLGGETRLYLRRLDELDPRAISGTEGASMPFFSPDGRWVAFYSGGSLKKVSLGGGVPLSICDTPPVWSATWGGDRIVFASTLPSSGLWLVSAEGGEPVQITMPKDGEVQHAYPQMLPGDTQVLFSVMRESAWRLAILSLDSREWRLLGNGRAVGEGARFVQTGHLVYEQSGGLVATRFDPVNGELDEASVPLLERIETSRFGEAYFAVAASTGTLVYVPAASSVGDRTLLRVDRDGRVAPMLDARLGYEHPAFSPDGKRAAVTILSDGGSDIWIIDLDRGTRIRFTSGGTSAFPVWAPDGSRLAFQSTAPGPWNLYWKPVDETAEARPLLKGAASDGASWPDAGMSLLPGTVPTLSGANPQFPMSWELGLSSLAFHERKPNGERDIWVVGPDGDPMPFLLTSFDERSPRFSPGGKWIAYVSNESGRDEVYVQPFPGPGRKWLISTEGGSDPVWSRDGRELFYRHDEQMMIVAIAATGEFSAARPRHLFDIRFDVGDNGPNYDIAPDGKWFLMPRSAQGPVRDELHLVLNWLNEVRARTR